MDKYTKRMLFLSSVVVFYSGFFFYANGQKHPDHADIVISVQRDTHNTVRVTGFAAHHDVSIVKLSTPRGPEIGYLIHHRYLALGPLMDLKSGQNVTPIWSRTQESGGKTNAKK